MRIGKRDEHPRVRFARMELEKLLRAVEALDGSELDAAMRVIELERLVEEERTLARHWRHCFEAMEQVAVALGPNGDIDRLRKAMREWAGKAA